MGAPTWVQTRSGKSVDLLDPKPEDIELDDIAWSLAHMNRFNGHVGHYTVARHSVLVYELVNAAVVTPDHEEAAAWALLHDAAEAYIGDLVSPFKCAMNPVARSAVREIEKGLQYTIWDRFGLDPYQTDMERVKQADMVLLATEAAVFFPEPERPRPWGELPPPHMPYLERIADASRFPDSQADYHRFLSAAESAGIA